MYTTEKEQTVLAKPDASGAFTEEPNEWATYGATPHAFDKHLTDKHLGQIVVTMNGARMKCSLPAGRWE